MEVAGRSQVSSSSKWADKRAGAVGGKYNLGPRIASGAFGEVYIGTDIRSGRDVAIKLEIEGRPDKYLRREAEIYQSLISAPRIPEMHWYGKVGESHAMVSELLGPSLGDLFDLCKGSFSLRTTLLLAEQLMMCIESVHSRGVVHRDIKPENFLIGVGPSKNTLHVIDFGLASFYRDGTTKQHIPFKEGRGRRGTRRYMSIQAGHGNEVSRRDDMESIGYMLVYFLNGKLPWQRFRGRNKDVLYQQVTAMKSELSPEELCEGHPPEFADYLWYCRSLGFEDEPDYAHLRSAMRTAYTRAGCPSETAFDWSGCVAGTARNAARGTKPPRRTREAAPPRSQAKERGEVTSETHSPKGPTTASPMSLRLPSLET